MPDRLSRRGFLATGGIVAIGGSAGCLDSPSSRVDPTNTDDPPEPLPADETVFRGDLRRHGVFQDVSVPDSPEIEWTIRSVNTGSHTAAKASPVATPDGDLVVPDDTGTVRRVTPGGETVWTTSVGDFDRGFHGTPAIANDTVYLGAYDGFLYAFDLASGDESWRVDLGDAIGSSPAYHDGTVYVAVEYYDPSGAMFGVDAGTGAVTWEDQRPTHHPHSTCAIDRDAGRLVVGANDGYLYAWTYPGLEFVWRFPTGRPIKGPIATYDGSAFFGSWDDDVYRVNLSDGSEEWSFGTNHYVMSGPAVEAVTDTVYVGSHDSRLYAIDATAGEKRWSFDTDGWIIGCPTVTDEHVLVGAYDEYCYAVDKTTGDQHWRVQGVGRVTGTPLVLDGAVYFTERASQTYVDGDGGATGGLYKVGSTTTTDVPG